MIQTCLTKGNWQFLQQLTQVVLDAAHDRIRQSILAPQMATYPKTFEHLQFPKYYPIEEGVRIRVVNSNNLSKDLVGKTLSLAKILSSEKLGDAMIYDIVMDLQDFLIKEINNNNMNSNNNLTNQHDDHKAEKVRVISDVKNSNYYFSQNQLGNHNNKPTKIIMKRQCTEKTEQGNNRTKKKHGG